MTMTMLPVDAFVVSCYWLVVVLLVVPSAFTTTSVTTTAFVVPSVVVVKNNNIDDRVLTSATIIATATATSSSRLGMANSKNIRAAMDTTEMYGITSPEAKLAWEVVEEFDASTNDKAAYTIDEAGMTKLSQEQISIAYEELQYSMDLMNSGKYTNAFASLHNNQQLMKDIAAELSAIKLTPPERKPAPVIPGLWDSKLKARAMTQNYGVESSEAKLAWEEVEEIASSGLQNSLGGTLYNADECDLSTAAEACMALEELDRFFTNFNNKQ